MHVTTSDHGSLTDSTSAARVLYPFLMRLSAYPQVIVRIGCSRCARQGHYRLARLAERYGSEIEMAKLLSHLAGDCSFRDTRRGSADFCGAFFPDISGHEPPDGRPTPARPKIVGGRAA